MKTDPAKECGGAPWDPTPRWYFRRERVQLTPSERAIIEVVWTTELGRDCAVLSIADLAATAGLSERQAKRVIAELLRDHLMERTRPSRRRRNHYSVRSLMAGEFHPEMPERRRIPAPRTTAREGTPVAPRSTRVGTWVSPLSGDMGVPTIGEPTTTETTSLCSVGVARARAREAPHRSPPTTTTAIDHEREDAPSWAVDRAARLLRHYARRTGQPVRAATRVGTLTPQARTIVDAVLEHPEIDDERWLTIIDRSLDDPWWKDEPSVGAIFAAKVLPQSIARAESERATPRRRETNGDLLRMLATPAPDDNAAAPRDHVMDVDSEEVPHGRP